ncbi:MAG TPA: methyltransferase domain-containing protein [Methylomirabilota bacterium]|jgi:SAM-dependent methyltransferase|nr:methyltransferase domain-containing protein [Methylomirabilota bacterium]
MRQEWRRCWCGGVLGKEIGPHYRRCNDCGAAVLAALPDPRHFDVIDDQGDFYGKGYWTEYPRTRNLPEIDERVRSDLSERCLFWLARTLEVTRPPGRFLEIGCGHGGFVRLMQELGFDATGTELSGWVVDFARRTFEVPVLRGRLETLDLAPGFTCIAAFDVLEHLGEPLETVRRCAELLAPDGVLLLQTPWYRGEGPDWSMFQEDEHIVLFTEESVRLLLARAGLHEIQVRPSLFPYDMWVMATPGRLHTRAAGDAEPGGWRLPAAFRALLDLAEQARGIRAELAEADADRAERLRQVEELTARIHTLEAARVEEARARQEDVDKLTALLREADADRAARLEDVERLSALLRESEADRAARLEQIHALDHLLRESEADRAARFEVIQNLQSRLAEIEHTWVWRLYEWVQSLTTGRRPRT